MKGLFNIRKSINVIKHINRSSVKNHFIITTDAEKAFNKIQHHFMIKALRKLGQEGMCLNIVKAICDKHHTYWSKTETISLKSIMRQGFPLSPLLFKT
jgi:hypothetical protein